MQDLHVRALYDGLKGHGSQANFMEEFLVGLGVKKPVGLTIPGRARVYAELAENAEDTIEIRMDNWGECVPGGDGRRRVPPSAEEECDAGGF